jgi:hypothetical protein
VSRIAELPKRDWRQGAEQIALDVTDLLRTPHGTQILRPVQGVALAEALQVGGLYASIRVGGGKTIISGLLPTILESRRPMLVVPASLVQKTLRDFHDLRLHWQIPTHIRIETYTKLSLEQHERLLWDYMPDLIVLDEAHKAKNVRQAATPRRIARYLHEHPECRIAALSGTPTKSSVLDYAHLLVWSLREGAPFPLDPDVQENWAQLLDSNVTGRPEYRLLHGDLGWVEDLGSAREAFRDRLTSTPGVIIPAEGYAGAGLEIQPIRLDPPKELDSAFTDLRELWLAPDGWALGDARFQVWALARQLALGFYYAHDPRPPADWWDARRGWCGFVRKLLEISRDFDTELQVWNACEQGRITGTGRQLWETWEAIRHTFKPNTVCTWLSDFAVEACVEWARRDNTGGIVWVEHTEFAERLRERTGWAYYGSDATDERTGMYIEDESPKSVVIASIHACREGVNLQHLWARNLVTSPPNPNPWWEQGPLGRTHRDGQRKATVTCDYFVACNEHVASIGNALREARAEFETTGREQKLLIGNLVLPTGGIGPAWEATISNENTHQ